MPGPRRWLSWTLPFAIIGGLLYAGLFVEPRAKGRAVAPPPITKRDAFFGLAVPSDEVIWAVGRGGKVVRSDDAGRTWRVQDASAAAGATLQGIAAWDARRAVAAGNGSTILSTEDGGATWRRAPALAGAPPRVLLAVRAAPAGRAFAVGELGTVLATADHGATWQAIGGGEDLAWNDVAALPDGTLVLVGEFGRIRRIEAAGAAHDVPSPVKASLTAVAFRDAATGVAVGLEGAVLVTRDGGRAWRRAAAGTAEHLFAVAAAPEGWTATGDKGVILRAGPEAVAWRAARVSDRDYSWFTAVVPRAGGLYLAGAALLELAGQKVVRFR